MTGTQTQQNKPVKKIHPHRRRGWWLTEFFRDIQTWFLSLTEQVNSDRKGYHSLTIQAVWIVWREKKNNRVFRDQWELAQRLMDELHDEAVLWMTGSQLSMGAGNDPVFHFSDLLFRQINCITAPIFTIHSRRRTSWSNAVYLLLQFQTKVTP